MWPESERARRRRDELVDEIIRSRCLENPRVEAAMRKVPRHFFLPGRNLDVVYQDRAIVTKRRGRLPISSSSQPCVMATMLEQLDVEPGHSVLEIGSGTGYNAALLAELSTPGGSVVTVDIDEDLVKSARRNLRRAGFEDVQVVLGDGGLGYRLAAPYDRIMATVGVWDLPPPWVEQLRPGGVLLAPLWFRGTQICVALERAGDELRSRSVRGCGFMRLRGAFAGPETFAALDEDGRRTIPVENERDPAVDRIRSLLSIEPRVEAVEFDWSEAASKRWNLFGAMGLLRADVWPLWDEEEGASWLVVTGDGIARMAAESEPILHVHGSESARDALVELLTAWDDLGRPGVTEVKVTCVPRGHASEPQDAQVRVFRKRWHDFLVAF